MVDFYENFLKPDPDEKPGREERKRKKKRKKREKGEKERREKKKMRKGDKREDGRLFASIYFHIMLNPLPSL